MTTKGAPALYPARWIVTTAFQSLVPERMEPGCQTSPSVVDITIATIVLRCQESARLAKHSTPPKLPACMDPAQAT